MTAGSALISRQPLLVLFLLAAHPCSSITHEDLFPSSQEEYDHRILDPKTVYGSPYGGFARASRSRLAALPLVFQGGNEDTDAYMSVSDGEGREFVCKTYQGQDIQSTNLQDSLFDPVVPRTEQDKEKEAAQMKKSTHIQKLQAMAPWQRENLLAVLEGALEGVCAQHNQEWWTYEWCFGETVRQYHAVRRAKGKVGFVRESMTLLGTFEERSMTEKPEVDMAKWIRNYYARHHHEVEIPPDHANYAKELAQDEFIQTFQRHATEVATLTETYSNGAMCSNEDDDDEASIERAPRCTTVHYRCCAPEEMKRLNPFIYYQEKHLKSDIAAIVNVAEPSTCHYELLICTPLLCHHTLPYYDGGPLAARQALNPISHELSSSTPKEDESIQDILDRSLHGMCFRTNANTEWWNYEYCHDRYVRQYHEATRVDAAGLASRHVDDEYVLGYYNEDEDEDIEKQDEHKHVVNIRDDKKGAYFAMEYTGGEECDGAIPRSTTVRYMCGPTYTLQRVQEDSTCHYVAEILVPELCHHVLFRTISEWKKQVVKCLPLRG